MDFFDLIKLWYWINDDKKMYSIEVHNRLYKSQLSESQLKEPIIKEEIDQKGYYDVKTPIHAEYLKILDLFVDKGYATKTNDIIHKINITYEYYPYSPFLSLNGIMGIKGNKIYNSKCIDLQSKEYENFIKTSKELKNQIDLGYHRHIRSFEYYEMFDFPTTVYEIKDKYLDIIGIRYNESLKIFEIDLVEPELIEMNNIYKKRYKIIKETKINFLEGATKIDPLIDSIQWKKEFSGIIISDKEPYKILNQNAIPTSEDLEDLNADPNYLGKDVFDINNLFARIFEDSLADYLRDQGYKATPRYKVEYFQSDIDVFAEKGQAEKLKLYCECKFRINNNILKIADIEKFLDKKKILLDKEKPGSKIGFWAVTNTDNILEETKHYCKQNGISLMKASLNRNWRNRANWRIHDVTEVN